MRSTNRGRGRRRLTALGIGLVVSYGLLELTSAIVIRRGSGRWLPPTELAAERRLAAVPDQEEPGAPATRRARRLGREYRDTVLHPYLGFVPDRPSGTAARLQHPSDLAVLLALGAGVSDQRPDDSESLVVGIFGGSVANVLATEDREILSAALATSRSVGNRPIEIVSVAYGGWKQPQQLMALTYLLSLGAHFDLVIELDGFNEVALPPAELQPLGVFPLYPRTWPFRVAALEPELLRSRASVLWLEERRASWARSFERAPLAVSYFAHWIWRLRDRQLEQRLASEQIALLDRDLGLTGYQTTGPAAPRDHDAYFDLIARSWQESSRSMAALCAAYRIDYLHVLQPNQYVPESKPLSARERRTGYREDHPYRAGVLAGYPKLRAAGAELVREGIAFLDLSELFINVTDTLYVDDCCHLNDRGNVLVAEEIARQLSER